jgi:hypothetical protein
MERREGDIRPRRQCGDRHSQRIEAQAELILSARGRMPRTASGGTGPAGAAALAAVLRVICAWSAHLHTGQRS